MPLLSSMLSPAEGPITPIEKPLLCHYPKSTVASQMPGSRGPGGKGGGESLRMPPHCPPPQLSDELKQHLNRTLTENYGQPRAQDITASMDRLQQDVSYMCPRLLCAATSSTLGVRLDTPSPSASLRTCLLLLPRQAQRTHCCVQPLCKPIRWDGEGTGDGQRPHLAVWSGPVPSFIAGTCAAGNQCPAGKASCD